LLINFRTQNFRSIRDLIELSLIVPAWTNASQDVMVPLPRQTNTRIGTVAGVFGANASGKSNVLEGIRAMQEAVINSHQRWDPEGGAPHEPFLLDNRHRGEPTMFEVDLLLDNQRYQYGFCLDKNGISSEWLYSYPENRRRVLYERNRDEEPVFRFGKSLTGPTAVLSELTRPNSLFLSVAAANNHRQLSRIYQWFSQSLSVVDPDEATVRRQQTIEALGNENLAPRIRDLLRLADLGIVDAQVTQKAVNEQVASWVKAFIEQMPGLPQGQIGNIERAMQQMQRSVELYHEAEKGTQGLPIPFDLESRGTRNWFDLASTLLYVLQAGAVLLIDELDASLHPYLSAEVIHMFHDPDVNRKGAQLIFTSHDPTLLGNLIDERPPLRRDEVWITEKDRTGATHLYALTDFKPRKSENLERGYLQGRYGGVPFVDHDRIRESVS
jgi:predicted ATPase